MGSAERGDLVVFEDTTGQVLRLAILFSSITLTPVQINNIRCDTQAKSKGEQHADAHQTTTRQWN